MPTTTTTTTTTASHTYIRMDACMHVRTNIHTHARTYPIHTPTRQQQQQSQRPISYHAIPYPTLAQPCERIFSSSSSPSHNTRPSPPNLFFLFLTICRYPYTYTYLYIISFFIPSIISTFLPPCLNKHWPIAL
ncbi:uncharacterized protein K452DRAFT_161069 [Aplosporella prunicola CBS 121167]|uniref:Uncharacterized protein n=1 Tax=Aplosporella prunicola CBS 121167 TaxID=1176127 RepID=A0A6A6BK85_9PEZI|nr:uncharacterized protein K452DRAFT_161069 [Aplosporella prunicola CBS 121167]KAF2143694.1 hypothetical protein K452DRAFT_161069 [Aplosporella prunicola CBS 121167]